MTAERRRKWKVEFAGNRSRGLLLALFLSAVATIAVVVIGGIRPTDLFARRPSHEAVAASQESIIADVDRLDLGTVWPNRSFKWSLPLRNTTNRDIAIADWDRSCICTRIEPQSAVIAANSVKTFQLLIDLTRHEAVDPHTMQRSFSVTFAPRSPEHFSFTPITVHGVVAVPLTCEPKTLCVETRVNQHGIEARPAIAIVRLHDKIADVKARCDQNIAVCSLRRRDKDHAYDLKVMPASHAHSGGATTVVLCAIQANGASLPDIHIPVRFTTIPEVTLSPQALAFGAVAVGAQRSMLVTLYSQPNSRLFVVKSVHSGSKGVEVSLHQLRDHTATYRVSVRPSKNGSSIGLVSFQVLVEGSPKAITLDLDVLYYGQSPATTTSGSGLQRGS
jgi:hypothetical protein